MNITVCRSFVSATLCLTLTLSPFLSSPAVAAGDDSLTPEACRAVGITLGSNDRDRHGRTYGYGGYASGGNAGAPRSVPMMAPAPPPPPPPTRAASPPPAAMVPDFSVGSSVQQVVVTGGRMQEQPDTQTYPHAVQNPVKRVADEPVSTFSIDVDTASYSNVRRFLTDGQRPPRDAVRVEEMINYFDYGYPLPASAAVPFSVTTALVPSPWSKHRILHIGLQGYDIPRAVQPPMNLVFLVDTSGSMMTEDRLPLAKKALNILVSQLRPQDHVSLVAYAGSAGAVLGPTGGNEKLKIRCALETLESGGSTAGGAGLKLAYDMGQQNFRKGAVNRIILMTDGDFNVGIFDPNRLQDFVSEKRKTGIYLSVYGFGRDNYHDTTMQALAQHGNGTASYIDTLDEARKLFRDDLSGSIFPIADDVKVQVEFNPAKVSEYRLIGYETRLLNREDFNNDQVDAGEVGSRASVTALYEVTMAGQPGASDPLRYGKPARPAADKGDELCFLKIRYKLPGQPNSHLMSKPVAAIDTAPTAAAAPLATRWALAVAAFGEKLRGSPWIDKGFGWNKVETLAQASRGDDKFGQRAEFVRLVRSARDTQEPPPTH